MKRYTRYTLGMLLILTAFPVMAAQDPPKAFQYEGCIYQVLTNITGNGLTSQTLPGLASFQIVHQKLDDVELVMEGKTLTWNGNNKPDHPRIIKIGEICLITEAEQKAALSVGNGSSIQYLEPAGDDLYRLKTASDTPLGILFTITPGSSAQNGILDGAMSFNYKWIKDRKPLKDVNLDAGFPEIGEVNIAGPIQSKLGEWSCFQIPVSSEGHIFIFLRATEYISKPDVKSEKKLSSPTPSTNSSSTGKSSDASTHTGPKITVGGEVDIRFEHRSR